MRVAVMGAGAMGSIYGGRLAEAGEDVRLIDIVPDIVSSINERGLRLQGNGGDRVINVRATGTPTRPDPVDLVIVFVKAFDTEQAGRDVLPLLGPQTAVLTLQNGLGNVEKLERMVGRERILAGAAYQAATFLAPGHVDHPVNKHTYVGELDGKTTERVRAVAAALNRAGLPATIVENPTTAIWGKLMVNIAVNALAAITKLPSGASIRTPEGDQLVENLLSEAVAVGRALDVQFPYDDPIEFVKNFMREPRPPSKPSMRQDIETGRRTEIDALNGAIAAEGARLGIPTPYNSAFACLVKLLEVKNREG